MLFDAVSTSLLLLSLTGLSLASSTPPSRQHGLTARSARHADKHHPGGAGSLQRRAPTPMYMRPPDKPWAEHSWDEKLEVLRRETIANDPNRDPMRSSNARTVPHMQENLAANPAAQHALRIAKEHGVSSNELFQRTHERLQIWPHEHPPQPGKDDVAIEKLKEHDARHPYTKGYMPHVHEHFKNGWDEMPFYGSGVPKRKPKSNHLRYPYLERQRGQQRPEPHMQQFDDLQARLAQYGRQGGGPGR